jgi:hypothetical protein
MNITHCRTTNAELALDNLISLDEDYKTTPIFAITPILPRPDEEELYIQFEEALHKRATASGSRLKHPRIIASLNHNVQRVLIYFCCALSCMLLGFDLMGLLILHMH